MYKELKILLEAAEQIGCVDQVDMGPWLPGKERICIKGTTGNGKPYELELTVNVEVEK